MSFSLSSIFGGGASTKPTEPSAAATVGQQGTPQTQSTPGNIPVVQPNLNSPTDAAPIHSPLDQFKTLWEPIVNKDLTNSSAMALDPAKLQELVAKADFSSTISRENLAKIAQGGEDAQKAFTDSMNTVAQQVMVQALLASNKITEQAVAKVNSAWETKLPEMLRKQTLSDNLLETNPIYSNPAIRPVIEAVQSQLTAKYPNATPTELKAMSNNFVKAMSEAFNPAPVVQTNKESFDWEKFLTPTT